MKNFSKEFEKLGNDGETKAVGILKDFGFILSRPDYSGYRMISGLFYGENILEEEDVEFEIKAKAEPFMPPPFKGHGTDIRQINKRMRRYKKYGFKQFFLVIQPDGKIYGQWLHKLEAVSKDKKFDTRNNIRIYSLSCFCEIPDIFGKEK
ncbi:MAG: hypothetical protein V3V81_07940 [Candidatus Bathyarchaeia archaeon]